MNERAREQLTSKPNADASALPGQDNAASGAPGFGAQRWSNLVQTTPEEPEVDGGSDRDNGMASAENMDPLIAPYPDDDDTLLPPLPDGGLARSMPSWLQPGPIADSGEARQEPNGVGEAWAGAPSSSADFGIEPEARTTADRARPAVQEQTQTGLALAKDREQLADEPVVLLEASDLPAWLRALDAPLNVPAQSVTPPAASGPAVILELFAPSIPASRATVPAPAAPIELPPANVALIAQPSDPVIDSGAMGNRGLDTRLPAEIDAPATIPRPESSAKPGEGETDSPLDPSRTHASGSAAGELPELGIVPGLETDGADPAPPALVAPLADGAEDRPEDGRGDPSRLDPIDREALTAESRPVIAAEHALAGADGERMVFGPPSDPVANDWVFGREAGSATADERELWQVSAAADQQRTRVLPALGAVILLFLIVMLIAYAGFTFR